jgi:hypothetical protein
MYTTLAGLPYLLEDRLRRYPQHELATSSAPLRLKALALRGLAQKDDALAVSFDFRRALGLHVATLSMALDATFVVIGGGNGSGRRPRHFELAICGLSAKPLHLFVADPAGIARSSRLAW